MHHSGEVGSGALLRGQSECVIPYCLRLALGLTPSVAVTQLACVSRRALQGGSGQARPLPVQDQALGGVAGPSLGPSLRRRSGDAFLLPLVRVEGTSVLGVLPF